MRDNLAKLIATGLYSGYMKPYPGTWGTIPAWLIAYFLIAGNTPVLIIATILCFFVSVWAAGRGEVIFGHDARRIVIDEWCGMFFTLLFIPFSLGNYIIAFCAFRFFDVVKIPLAAQAEKLPGGWGVTTDDVVAGIQANIIIRLLIHFNGSFGINIPFIN